MTAAPWGATGATGSAKSRSIRARGAGLRLCGLVGGLLVHQTGMAGGEQVTRILSVYCVVSVFIALSRTILDRNKLISANKVRDNSYYDRALRHILAHARRVRDKLCRYYGRDVESANNV